MRTRTHSSIRQHLAHCVETRNGYDGIPSRRPSPRRRCPFEVLLRHNQITQQQLWIAAAASIAYWVRRDLDRPPIQHPADRIAIFCPANRVHTPQDTVERIHVKTTLHLDEHSPGDIEVRRWPRAEECPRCRYTPHIIPVFTLIDKLPDCGEPLIQTLILLTDLSIARYRIVRCAPKRVILPIKKPQIGCRQKSGPTDQSPSPHPACTVQHAMPKHPPCHLRCHRTSHRATNRLRSPCMQIIP